MMQVKYLGAQRSSMSSMSKRVATVVPSQISTKQAISIMIQQKYTICATYAYVCIYPRDLEGPINA